MAQVRRKVLKQFTRNIGGQIITGHPEHPKEHGRFLMLDADVADRLAAEGFVGDKDTTEKMPTGKARSGAQQAAGDTLLGLADEGEGQGEGGGDTGAAGGGSNLEGADGSVVGANASQTVREKRTAGKPISQDQKRGRVRRQVSPKTDGAAGSTSTETSTNHPGESGPNTAPAEIPGNTTPAESDPDAAPTSGSEG